VRGAVFYPLDTSNAVIGQLVRIRRETLTTARKIAA
jgi:hypothetical protein